VATRHRKVRRRRKVTRPKKVRVAKPPRARSSLFRSHRGRSTHPFRAHKGRHATVFRAHGRRRLAAHAKHPKAIVVRAHHSRARRKATVHTVASHRCGQPLTHSTRHVSAATRKKLSHSLRARHTHLSKSEKARISKALKGHHHTCACKTVGAVKHKARSKTHRHLSARTRAKISARLRKEHAGTKWGKAARGWHKGHTAPERARVLKAAKASSGRSKVAAKKPC
jgi:hypothetical protein